MPTLPLKMTTGWKHQVYSDQRPQELEQRGDLYGLFFLGDIVTLACDCVCGDNVVLSPLPTCRTRTFSATVRVSLGTVYKGVCKCFCCSKGHDFITLADGGPDIFLHISDVEGEYVSVEGDEVTYKMCSIPPKNERLQAVEVVITHLAPGTKHETWSGHVVSS
ncbi:calcium-regulated heat-stable protein 1-like [Erinaceus europaeus]|uniref:Calcium-regulated heat-stable protein 1-like n=1 Tax=Erinaceus europaeus TaxID=9365 RepID=A0ABM3VUV3_ERIEU|nr:calcium-regulated heat-stable protein 1-like [Erinaceus europaeus]